MKKTYLYLLIFFFPLISNSQKEYKPGVIYITNQDSIKTRIIYGGDKEMSQTCRYMLENNQMFFSPDQIVGYKFENGRYFISKKIDGKNRFLEYLIKGEINIYYLRQKEGDTYYIQKKGEEIIELEYISCIKDIYDEKESFVKTVDYKSTMHIGLLRYIMMDQPSVFNDINEIKVPNHHELIDVAKKYHNKKCNGEDCIIYYKEDEELFFDIEASSTLLYFPEYEETKMSMGIGVNIWMPKYSENLYMYVGYENMFIKGMAKDKYLNLFPEDIDFIKLNLKYKANFTPIDYYLKGGLCFYYDVRFFYNIDTGISYNLFENLNINLGIVSYFGYEGQATVIPNDLISIGGNLGLSWVF